MGRRRNVKYQDVTPIILKAAVEEEAVVWVVVADGEVPFFDAADADFHEDGGWVA